MDSGRIRLNGNQINRRDAKSAEKTHQRSPCVLRVSAVEVGLRSGPSGLDSASELLNLQLSRREHAWLLQNQLSRPAVPRVRPHARTAKGVQELLDLPLHAPGQRRVDAGLVGGYRVQAGGFIRRFLAGDQTASADFRAVGLYRVRLLEGNENP